MLVDETSDISGLEQVSICARYVNTETMTLCEDFLNFVRTSDLTGAGLSDLILSSLRSFGVDVDYLRGQGYDGAAAMSGAFNGVRAHISRLHPLALYTHCTAHSLNLVVSKACEVHDIRNCLGVIGKAHAFFSSPKRKHVLSKEIEENSELSTNIKSLKRNCATRWIERYHSVSDFFELLLPVLESLDSIATWRDFETSRYATILKNSILQPAFILSVFVLRQLFGIGLTLSKHLQKINTDLKCSLDMASAAQKELRALRDDAQVQFHKIFLEAQNLGE